MLSDRVIRPVDLPLAAQVQAAIDAKTKPPGSLGRIERLALQLALAQGTDAPAADPAHLLIFAGDHGLVAEGVSAWPQEVTAQMVLNFLSGGAAANVFARTNDVRLTVADAGVAVELPDTPGLRRAGIRAGTRNAARQDAMTHDEMSRALTFGAALADEAIEGGARVIAIGEMGIGNTASAALLAHALAGLDLPALTGPGAGLDADGVARKQAILASVAARRPGKLPPEQALTAFGGLEIAAMAGALIGGAARGAAVLVDGFIATAAAMVALTARPEAAPYAVFAHRSHEPGHRLMLQHLGVEPILDLDLRLGEGTGALLAVPVLRAACAMLADMATFESAGVSGKADP
ncbi:MAG: nicotinate-nucleotide--dimethylbenzimidazole phosphoribosyltransferase [Pseudomonadota bacterium]